MVKRTLKKWESCAAVTKSIEDNVTHMSAKLDSLHSALPRLLGYTWEGGFSTHDKPVMLMDALGRNLPIPFLFCTSSKVGHSAAGRCRSLIEDTQTFHDLLELMFRQLPGYSKVVKEEYHLRLEDMNGTLLRSDDWTRVVTPGAVLVMSIVIRASFYCKVENDVPDVNCPRCHLQLPRSQSVVVRWSVSVP